MRIQLLTSFLTIIAFSVATGSARAEELKVLASIKPLHSLVANVIEGVGTPQLLVEGAASVHGYSLKPSQRAKVEDAEIVFYIGSAMESFLPHVLEEKRPGHTAIAMMDEGMQLLPNRENALWEGEEDAHEEGEAHEHHGLHDPHIWLSPENAKRMVEVIARELSKRYPKHAQQFAENAHLTSTRIELQALAVSRLLAPVHSKPFIVFHDGYHYFEKSYDLHPLASVTLTPEESVSANRVTALLKILQEKKVQCLFREPNMAPKLMQQLLEGGTAREGTLDPEATMLQPGKELYFQLVQQLGGNLYQCLSAAK